MRKEKCKHPGTKTVQRSTCEYQVCVCVCPSDSSRDLPRGAPQHHRPWPLLQEGLIWCLTLTPLWILQILLPQLSYWLFRGTYLSSWEIASSNQTDRSVGHTLSSWETTASSSHAQFCRTYLSYLETPSSTIILTVNVPHTCHALGDFNHQVPLTVSLGHQSQHRVESWCKCQDNTVIGKAILDDLDTLLNRRESIIVPPTIITEESSGTVLRSVITKSLRGKYVLKDSGTINSSIWLHLLIIPTYLTLHITCACFRDSSPSKASSGTKLHCCFSKQVRLFMVAACVPMCT